MFDVALAEEIWTSKYRFRTDDGDGDGSFADTARRVALTVASVEAPQERALWEGRFREAIEDFRFIPAGRICGRAAGPARCILARGAPPNR